MNSGDRSQRVSDSETALADLRHNRDDPGVPLASPESLVEKSGASLLTLERSLMILDSIAAAPNSRGLGHAAIARQLGFQRSTLYRYLSTLEALGLVESDRDTHRYRLGPRLLVLGAAALGERSFTRYTKEFVNQLAARTGETAHATVFDLGCSVTVDIADGAGPIGPRVSIGSRRPAHCSASGKIFLAFQPDALRNEYLAAPLERKTPTTVTDPDELNAHLREVRRRGFSTDHAECSPGICCVAAPVFDFRGHVVGSFCISIAASRLTPDHLRKLRLPLLQATKACSREMGYSVSARASS
jgi:IclR family KDG regulon transcriptional repressor